MNNWRWKHPCAFGDPVGRSNEQTTSSWKVTRTGERFSWSGINDLRANSVSPGCGQYKPGNFLAVRPPHWDETIDEDADDVHSADSGSLNSGRRRPGDVNDNDGGQGEDDTQGAVEGTREGEGTKDGKEKAKATEDGKGKGKGKGNANGKGKGILKQTPGGYIISRAVALQLRKEMSEADLDTEG